jgi:hypothetical protein
MDRQLDPPYASVVDNDTRGWVRIDLETLRPGERGDPPVDRPIPFQVFGNRFKSSSADSELFIHDPLLQMQRSPGDLKGLDVAGFRGDDLELDIEALRDRWHLTTYVANHHRGLNRIYHYAMLTVGPDGLHLMIYKDFDRDA